MKATPEDFRVDELPAYLPSGAGPHLYLLVEKRGRTTRDVVRELAALLGVPERDAGYAGLKDKVAVSTQWLSFPAARDPGPAALAGDGWRVLERSRHANKLRPGHARGNRFAVAVRGGDPERARAAARALGERGLPNFFGAQRFGAAGENASLGRAILLGRADSPEARRAARDRFLRRLCISAYQSLLFNRWLEERMRDALFDRALLGDVMRKLRGEGEEARLGPGGPLFTCTDPAADGPRIARFEISPAGPMFGHALRLAGGEAGPREERLLAEEGLSLADFSRGGDEAEGTRRAARLPVQVAVEDCAGGYRATFDLPRGSYATVVLGELVKGAAPPELDAGE